MGVDFFYLANYNIFDLEIKKERAILIAHSFSYR
jgi:hypothetical protein